MHMGYSSAAQAKNFTININSADCGAKRFIKVIYGDDIYKYVPTRYIQNQGQTESASQSSPVFPQP